MVKQDFTTVTIIGVAIGILAQLVLGNLMPTTPILRVGVVLGCTLFAPFCLLVAYFLGKLVPALYPHTYGGKIGVGVYQFAKFGAVGTLNSLIDLAVLNIAIMLTGVAGGFWYPFIKGFSFFCATTNSFLWNRWWTFGQSQTSKLQTAQFYGIAATGWVINVAVASFVVNGVSIPGGLSANAWANVGALAGIGASFLFNFVGYKFWVFRHSKEQIANSQ
ncbi:MAG: GtrA family protein [Candidatus Liptonbacteria bacterium]|nr:GtrA family protein [Candidatus Liptonbacteria bacterium]